MLSENGQVPSQRQLLHLIRLLALQHAHFDAMVLSEFHHGPISDTRPRSLARNRN